MKYENSILNISEEWTKMLQCIMKKSCFIKFIDKRIFFLKKSNNSEKKCNKELTCQKQIFNCTLEIEL